MSDVIVIEPFLRVNSVLVESSLPFLATRAARQKRIGSGWEERRRKMRRAKSWPALVSAEREGNQARGLV